MNSSKFSEALRHPSVEQLARRFNINLEDQTTQDELKTMIIELCNKRITQISTVLDGIERRIGPPDRRNNL